MKVIENRSYGVIRTETEPPTCRWERTEFPKDDEFLCKIQSLTLRESREISISLEVLEDIARQARLTREKYFEEWSNPVTRCCGVPRPRNETNQDWFLERFEITCKPGYGCKRTPVLSKMIEEVVKEASNDSREDTRS